jgi:hypothetical protein
MFRPLASLLVVIPLALANSAFAEETSDGAAAAPASAEETGATPAGTAATPESGVAPATTPTPPEAVIAYPNDRLPTAERPGFFKLHPLTLPSIKPPKIEIKDWKPGAGYIGAGFFNDMVSVDSTVLTPKGIFYARVGRFMDAGEGVAVNGGWRNPLNGKSNANGYAVGVFVGHVIGDSLDNKVYNRLGGGADISYQWVNEHTLKVFSIGLGAGKVDEGIRGGRKSSTPKAFFSYSVSLKVF